MSLEGIFFTGWETLLRTLVVGALAYAALVAFLRLSGKRTLSKMNAFDLVVTVALGSTLATILLNGGLAQCPPALQDAEAVVLETDGSFGVVRRSDGAQATSLSGVKAPLPGNES